jgi:hypothetical protein
MSAYSLILYLPCYYPLHIIFSCTSWVPTISGRGGGGGGVHLRAIVISGCAPQHRPNLAFSVEAWARGDGGQGRHTLPSRGPGVKDQWPDGWAADEDRWAGGWRGQCGAWADELSGRAAWYVSRWVRWPNDTSCEPVWSVARRRGAWAGEVGGRVARHASRWGQRSDSVVHESMRSAA